VNMPLVNMPLPQFSEELPESLESLPLSSRDDSTPLDCSEKITAQGRFFFNNHEKFFLKGVTYGPFAPSLHGDPFPEAARVEMDFTLMGNSGPTVSAPLRRLPTGYSIWRQPVA